MTIKTVAVAIGLTAGMAMAQTPAQVERTGAVQATAQTEAAFVMSDDEVKDLSLIKKDFQLAQAQYQIQERDLMTQLQTVTGRILAAHGSPKDVQFDMNKGYFVKKPVPAPGKNPPGENRLPVTHLNGGPKK